MVTKGMQTQIKGLLNTFMTAIAIRPTLKTE
jgi:hypothetical protein